MSTDPISVSAVTRPRPSDLLATPESPAKPPAEILKHEEAYLDDLLALAREKQNERDEIVYYKKDPKSPTGVAVKIRFNIKVLESKQIDDCRAEHVTPAKIDAQGRATPERFDRLGYQCKLVYLATDPEDKLRLWDNPRYHAQAPLPWLLIDKVLKPGERLDALSRVLDLAGLGALPEPVVEEAAGN